MAKIKKNPLLPPLRVSDFGKADGLVCQIKEMHVDVGTTQTRSGKTTFAELYEFPGKGLYMNATSLQNAVDGFGSDETDNWLDKQIPIIKVHAAFTDKTTQQEKSGPNLWVAPAEDWKSLMKSLPKAQVPKPTT
jgi:hypothetical protein